MNHPIMISMFHLSQSFYDTLLYTCGLVFSQEIIQICGGRSHLGQLFHLLVATQML